MNLINSSVEFIPQEKGIDGIYKQIETAGRICYKSEPNASATTSKEFVDKLIKSGHLSVLEHGTVYLAHRTRWIGDSLTNDFEENPYSKTKYVNLNEDGYKEGEFCITTNYRVLVENGWLYYLEEICEPTPNHEKRYTFKITSSIGIVRELLRHRVFSFSNESTRYCNYAKDRFNNEITFIKPYWFDDADTTSQTLFKNSLQQAENTYMEFINKGITPQQAREVLPLCTKSELIMTGFESDWEQFLKLRLDGVAGTPHPDMKVIAAVIKEELNKR